MALFRCHRLLVPLLLALLFAASHGDDSYNPSMCLRSHRCGNINISYPFYLFNETAPLLGGDGSYCGYPGLGIQCNEDSQALLLDNYRILSINNFTVTVVDQDIPVDESCTRIDRNVTLPAGSWLATSVDYIFFFLNCFPNMLRPMNISPSNCSSSSGLFVAFWGNETAPEDLFLACPSMVKVPVLQLPDVPWKDSQWIYSGYNDALRRGFNLEWDQGKDALCAQCEESYGKCGYKDGEFKGCLCPDGRVQDQSCPNNSSDRFGWRANRRTHIDLA